MLISGYVISVIKENNGSAVAIGYVATDIIQYMALFHTSVEKKHSWYSSDKLEKGRLFSCNNNSIYVEI